MIAHIQRICRGVSSVLLVSIRVYGMEVVLVDSSRFSQVSYVWTQRSRKSILITLSSLCYQISE